MNQWKVILATLLIFGSGVGTGLLLDGRKPATDSDESFDNHSSTSRQTQRLVFFRSTGFLQKHLNLSEEQKKQIQEIMVQSSERIRSKSTSFREKLSAEHNVWERAVRQVLTLDQANQFDRLPQVHFRNEPGRPSGRPELPSSHPRSSSPLAPPSTNAPRHPHPQKPKPKGNPDGKSIS